MENSKFYLDSTTIKSILVAIAPTIILILKAFGVDIGESEIAQLIEAIISIIAAVTLIGALVGAWVGRVKAKQPLSYAKSN